MASSPLTAAQLGSLLVGHGLLALGLGFDLLSLVALITTWRGRRCSGFPFLGGLFYLVFTLGAARGTFRAFGLARPALLGLGLIVLHALIQWAHAHARALDRLERARPAGGHRREG